MTTNTPESCAQIARRIILETKFDTYWPPSLINRLQEELDKELAKAKESAEYAWKNTNILEKERQRLEKKLDELAKQHSQLMIFYMVGNTDDLIAAMERHIERLQSKLPPVPDLQPKRVREG